MWKQHITSMVVLILVISNVIFIISPEFSPVENASAVGPPIIEDATTYWEGDWWVDSDITYKNQTIIDPIWKKHINPIRRKFILMDFERAKSL